MKIIFSMTWQKSVANSKEVLLFNLTFFTCICSVASNGRRMIINGELARILTEAAVVYFTLSIIPTFVQLGRETPDIF